MSELPHVAAVASIVEGPQRIGSERRWSVRLHDGRPAVLGQLLPELARDLALRRRYVRDVRRLAALHISGLAATMAFDEGSSETPPWRLREQPTGENLADWLARRAPAPVDEVRRWAAELAAVLDEIHAHGLVLRDLQPRNVVLADRPILIDVGLARVDLLSTRTAASLIVEGSPWASPEQLRRTTLDQRSDLWALGVMLFQAVTGVLPHGDQPAILVRDLTPPDPCRLRSDLPDAVARLVRMCMAESPDNRPAGAHEVARVLRGEGLSMIDATRTSCQSCGASMRVGQRLCVSCGREAVQFVHAPADAPENVALVLKKVKEDAEHLGKLRDLLAAVSEHPVPALNFIIGDKRMYSKAERARLLGLPLVLFDGLAPDTAGLLAERFERQGIAVAIRSKRGDLSRPTKLFSAVVAGLAFGIFVTLIFAGLSSVLALAIAMALAGFAMLIGFVSRKAGRNRHSVFPLLELRRAPAALPASDPLVARLAGSIQERTPADVRERVGELALAIQRLVDHRARLGRGGAERSEVDLVLTELEPVVALIEREVGRIANIDVELAELDEGALVRGLAAAEARHATPTEREELLHALDRLRVLEDARAASFRRLLQAGDLLRRGVELGLNVRDPELEHARHVRLAIDALGGVDSDDGRRGPSGMAASPQAPLSAAMDGV